MNLNELTKRAFSILFLSMLCCIVFAQGHKVSGIIKDTSGEPMIGVNVMVKGTTNGTITDFDGKFTISNVPTNSTLSVSYIGYLPQAIKYTGQKSLLIVLKEDNKTLDEVVVIGYGTVKRKDLTGAVASVSGDKLKTNPVSNVTQALQGQLPGVAVTSQDGRPGASMSIKVRGGGSITQSNDPLFVVDGVEVGNISDIPADNIESIDVLKDAASTAIYGARGANGVILVTTKTGKEGKTQVNYNMYYQIKENPELLETLDAYDLVYSTWSYATAYGGSYGDGVAKYYGLGSSYGNHLNEYKNVKSHNYINDLMRTASSWNHDLSISGGNDKTKFYATVNYADDQGIRIQSGYKRWNANMKLEQKINKNLKANFDIRYSEVTTDGTKFDNATSVYKYKPIDNPLGDPTYIAGLGQGDSNVDEAYNPLTVLNNYQKTVKEEHIRAKSGLTWNIIKGLTANSELSLNRSWTESKDWDNGMDGYKKAVLTKKDGYSVRWASTLNYEVQGLGDNSLSVLLGNEVLASKSNSTGITGVGYPNEFTMKDAFGMINMTDKSLGRDAFSSSIGTPSHTQSWFGRTNLSLQGKYLLTATFRADGSSKFSPDNHWGYFPAAAAAWRISEEKFLKDVKCLDNLKLRISYGTSGSDNISSSLWKETWQTKEITVDGEKVTTYVPGDMQGNPDLKWETTTSRNIGLDFGFLNNRIYGSVDVYCNTTKNILMKIPTAASSGYQYQFQNVGQTSNKGVEVSLGTDIVRSKDFNLNLNLTYNMNKNKVDKLNDNAIVNTRTSWASFKPTYDYIVQVGQPVGLIQGFVADGFYTVDDFNYVNGSWILKDGVPDIYQVANCAGSKGYNLPEGQSAFPGVNKFKDISGPDGKPDGVVDSYDVKIIGKTTPKHTGGFNLTGNYQNLDFSLGFVYQIGGKIYNANSMYAMMGGKDTNFGANRLKFTKDCYKLYDIDANGDIYQVTTPEDLRALNANAKYGTIYNESGIVSSQFVEDASYLRLNILTVGYTLPKSWTSKVGISNCRLYFTGNNLFCLSGYSGIDPDVNTQASTSGFPSPNFDYNSYPKARTYTFGLNLSF